MIIERNLISPLRMQIEKIIKNNAENGKLVASIDKDRPNSQKRQNNDTNQEPESKSEHSIETPENLREESRKLDLIA